MIGTLFDGNSSENRSRRALVHERCRAFTRSPSRGHLRKLKDIFLYCGEGVRIEYGFHCDYGNKISIGKDVYINMNCCILDGGLVDIGSDVLIGPNVQIITVNHDTNAYARLNKKSFISNVVIGNNVWIGAGAIILPGVTIANDVVIAAGSVINKDLESHYLYAGNPAKKIKSTG